MAVLKPKRGAIGSSTLNNLVLEKGEIFFEYPSAGVGKGLGKIKMGDGVTKYSDLPYFIDLSNVSGLPLSGGTMSEDAQIRIPCSGGISGGISIYGDGYHACLYPAQLTAANVYTDRIMPETDIDIQIGSSSGAVKTMGEHQVMGSLTDKNGVPFINSQYYEYFDIYPFGGSSSVNYADDNYWWVKFNSGIMIIAINHALVSINRTHQIWLPQSFVNKRYAILMHDNGNFPGGNSTRVCYVATNTFQFMTETQHYSGTDYAECGDSISIICVGRWK